MMRLVDDVCRIVENNPVTWENIDKFDRHSVRNLCRENSLIAVFNAVMIIYAKYQNANSWLCKSMQNIRWAKQLNDYLQNAKFIYLYRDPRDVALSFGKAVIGDKHPFNIAKKWVELQEYCLDAEKWLPANQFKRVCYEELTSNPDYVIEDLCDFLGIRFIPEMLNFHRSSEASRTATQSSLWSNLTQPLMSTNSNKFINDMPEQHIKIIESVAGKIMDQLGYERHLVQPGSEQTFSTHDIELFDKENEMHMVKMSKLTDPEDLRRRQKQLNVIKEIKEFICHSPAQQTATG
jgi:hypothetical protein